MESGLIFNIQKYSLQDGPGIRTTVFLKGCPLCCAWCHNPESISARREIVIVESRCIACGECRKRVPVRRIVRRHGPFCRRGSMNARFAASALTPARPARGR